MTAVSSKKSDPEGSDEEGRRFFRPSPTVNDAEPPCLGLRTGRSASDKVPRYFGKFGNPTLKTAPVSDEKRGPVQNVQMPSLPRGKPMDGFVLDEAIRLGKPGKETDRLPAPSAPKTTDLKTKSVPAR